MMMWGRHMTGQYKTLISNNFFLKQYAAGIIKTCISIILLSIVMFIVAPFLYNYQLLLYILYTISVIIIMSKIIAQIIRPDSNRNVNKYSSNPIAFAIGGLAMFFTFFSSYAILIIMLIVFDFMMVTPNSPVETFHYYMFIPVISLGLAVVFIRRMFETEGIEDSVGPDCLGGTTNEKPKP